MKKLLILFATFFSISVSLAQTIHTGKVIAIKGGDTAVVIDSLKTSAKQGYFIHHYLRFKKQL